MLIMRGICTKKTHFPLNVDDRSTHRPTDGRTDGYGNGEKTSKSLWRKIRNKTENDMMIN